MNPQPSSHNAGRLLPTPTAAATFFTLGTQGSSEARIGWRWLLELSRTYSKITAIAPAPVVRALEEQDAAALPSNVRLAATRVAPFTPRSKTLVPAHYQYYAQWLAEAACVARELGAQVNHQVTYGSPYWGSAIAGARGIKVLGPVGVSPMAPPWALPLLGIERGRLEIVRAALAVVRAPVLRPFAAVAAADITLASDPRAAALALGRHARFHPFLQDGGDPIGRHQVKPWQARHDLVWVGRMLPRKAPVLAVRAFTHVAGRVPPDARLIMVGAGPETPAVERAISESGLGDRIVLTGRLPNELALPLIAGARALVFTSLRDTFGGVNLEAASQGTPVITARHRGVAGLHLWFPTEGMWTGPARTLRECLKTLSRGMTEALQSDEEEWTKRSDAALDFAHRHSWERRRVTMANMVAELLAC